MSRPATLDICKQHLYDDIDELTHLPEETRNRLLRIRSGYTYWNQYPSKRQKEIVDHIIKLFGVKKTIAYEDLRLIKTLIGSIEKASKDWHLYETNKWLDEAYRIAKSKNNELGIIKAAKERGKINQLDKADTPELPWEEIAIQPFEITGDPRVLGLKPIPNLRGTIDNMLKRYSDDIVEDVTYEEVDVDVLKKFDNA